MGIYRVYNELFKDEMWNITAQSYKEAREKMIEKLIDTADFQCITNRKNF